MLKEKIKENLKTAMKGGNDFVTGTLRMLLAAMISKEKEKKFIQKIEGDVVLTDDEMLSVITFEVKKRKDAIALYNQGNRPELAEKEAKEIEILKEYLPEQLSEEEIKKMVHDSIAKTGAKEIKDMGKVMTDLSPKIKGRADGGDVSKIIKGILSNN